MGTGHAFRPGSHAIAGIRRGWPSSQSAIAEVQQVPDDAVEEGGGYEPVRSKIAPDIQPPSAMPTIVAMTTAPMRAPASRGAKYSRTIMA